MNGAALPTFDQICLLKKTLVGRIPARARTLWAEVLAKEMQCASTLNVADSWARLFMLAKCCLWIPQRTRGGRKGSRGACTLSAIITKRLRRWQQGDVEGLWLEASQQRSDNENGRSRDAGPASIRRAKKLASEGLYGRACQAMSSPGIHNMTEDVKKSLVDLHPQSLLPTTPDDLPESLDFACEEIL